jgi:hypothetical protein
MRKLAGEDLLPAYFPVLSLFVITTIFGLLYDRMGDVAALRYFAPIYLALPLGIAWIIKRLARLNRLLALLLLFLYLANNLSANLEVWRTQQTPHPFELVAQRLKQRGVVGGYADYRLAYCITFLSQEKVRIAPTTGIDRYPPYTRFVQGLDRIVWIQDLVEEPRQEMEIHGIRYKVKSEEVCAGIRIKDLEKI